MIKVKPKKKLSRNKKPHNLKTKVNKILQKKKKNERGLEIEISYFSLLFPFVG